jgi:AcrR family transcriptional regulator
VLNVVTIANRGARLPLASCFNDCVTSSDPQRERAGAAGPARVGRPSKAAERRAEIVDAFIRLVAVHGLEGVTLGGVASEAGVQRAAARHFVGNRPELIAAAIEELTRRYRATVEVAVGEAPSIERLIDALFGRVWVHDLSDVSHAFDALMQEAARHEPTRVLVKQAYEVLLDEIDQALERSRPLMSAAERRDAAYAIACLAEQNALMQQLGFPAARSVAAKRCAWALVPSG